MNKKTIGYIVSALIIGTLIFIMVKNTVNDPSELEADSVMLGEAATPADGDLAQYSPAPDFTLDTLAGEAVTLSELKGKKVILNFWATWCPPCKAEMPHMQNYYSKLTPEDNVELIAVNVTGSEKLGVEEVQNFVSSYKLDFPIPLDPVSKVTAQYGVFSMPTTYMIDTEGRIAQKIVGPLDEKMITELVDFMN